MGSSGPQDASELKALVQQLSKAADGYNGETSAAGYISRTNIIQKAKEIARLMMAPSDMSMHHSLNMMEMVAVRTLLEFDVLNAIPMPGSISLADLSAKTKLEDSLLERQLRLLVGTGFLDMTENFEYKHTKFSDAYRQVPGPGNFFQFMNDECMATLVHFHTYLSEVRGPPYNEPDDPLRNPYTSRHNMDGHPVWEVMAQFPKRIKAFQLGFMSQEDSVPIIGFYDFSKLYDAANDGDRMTLVDVGGGQGQSLAQILKAYPTLDAKRLVLQDLPQPIEQAQLELPSEMVKMVHDFWTPQPIKGAKAYLLRRVVHDYSDENVVKILTHLKNAMEADSRILIADMVMPKRVREADLPAAAMDCTVMVMGGKERTEEGFVKLLEEAGGLELVKIHRIREGGASGNIVEVGLKH